jgi:hypothetical protein
MVKTTEFRDSTPPEVEAIGHGKWLVHWNIEELTDPDNEERIYYRYNEVKLDHNPTKKEVTKIKAL